MKPTSTESILQEFADIRARLVKPQDAEGEKPTSQVVNEAIDRAYPFIGAVGDVGRSVRGAALSLVSDLAEQLPENEKTVLLEEIGLLSVG